MQGDDDIKIYCQFPSLIVTLDDFSQKIQVRVSSRVMSRPSPRALLSVTATKESGATLHACSVPPFPLSSPVIFFLSLFPGPPVNQWSPNLSAAVIKIVVDVSVRRPVVSFPIVCTSSASSVCWEKWGLDERSSSEYMLCLKRALAHVSKLGNQPPIWYWSADAKPDWVVFAKIFMRYHDYSAHRVYLKHYRSARHRFIMMTFEIV